jgi:hypothetical protein
MRTCAAREVKVRYIVEVKLKKIADVSGMWKVEPHDNVDANS